MLNHVGFGNIVGFTFFLSYIQSNCGGIQMSLAEVPRPQRFSLASSHFLRLNPELGASQGAKGYRLVPWTLQELIEWSRISRSVTCVHVEGSLVSALLREHLPLFQPMGSYFTAQRKTRLPHTNEM